MNNEIEQIAQQNDMSVEFVRWFFSEKKAACGEQWFLALGAMWEGWEAREGEATALALTLEKSREASGCPAGVDLQDWVKQLAAENVALKGMHHYSGLSPKHSKDAMLDMKRPFIDELIYSAEFYSVCGHISASLNRAISAVHGDYSWLPETPATDRIVAGIKADGVEMFAKYQRAITEEWACKAGHSSLLKVAESAELFAKQLREGADK
ncbi:TPA: hypothetical protein RFL89_001037 [Klebsiella aerogenes]|nr:hypothetical protein [Klebsiella aerogenes]